MAEENNTISKLEDLLRGLEKQDYIKIKYEDLTETLEEAIKLIQTLQKEKERLGKLYYNANESRYKNRDLIQKQQEKIEKKDKIINEMLNTFAEVGLYNKECKIKIDTKLCDYDCIQCIKQDLEKKVEGK